MLSFILELYNMKNILHPFIFNAAKIHVQWIIVSYLCQFIAISYISTYKLYNDKLKLKMKGEGRGGVGNSDLVTRTVAE